ncbi:MAG: exo-alpha-sialidase [Bryobacteraceae bacterium]
MKPRVCRAFVWALILLTPIIGAAPAQLFQWKNVNIQGMGYVTGLIATARADGSSGVYIRTDVGGAYFYERAQPSLRSAQAASSRAGGIRPSRVTDQAGDRWIPLLEGIGLAQVPGVESIATETLSPDRVYVAVNWPTTTYLGSNGYTQYNTSGEVLVSDDHGNSWQPTGLAAQNVLVSPNGNYRVETGERLASDPNAAGVVYFATRTNGLWKGVRNSPGAPAYTWTEVQGGLPNPASLNEPAAGGSGDQPGFTFVLLDKSTIAYNPVSGAPYTQTIYVGVHSSGVWRSKDGGNSWSLLSGGPTDPVRAAITANGTIYVSCGTQNVSGTVWSYANSGWTNITPAPQSNPYTGITSDPTNGQIVMVGNSSTNTVWRSTNGGSAWSSQQMSMQGHDPLTPGTNPSAPLYYIATTAGCNGGMAALMIDPAYPQQVWWTNGWGVARTDDVGATTPFWAWHMQNLEELVAVGVRVPPKPKSAGGADLLSMAMDMIGFRHADRDQVPTTKISPAGVPLDPVDASWEVSEFGGSTYPVPWPNVSMGNNLDYCYTQPDNLAYVGWGEWEYWSNYGFSSDNGQTWTAFPSVPSEMLWSNGTQMLAQPIAGQIAMSATNPQNMVWVPGWGTFGGTAATASAANAPWPHYTRDGGRTWSLCLLANPPAKPNPYNSQNNNDVHYNALPQAWTNAPSPWVVNNILAADRADPAGTTYYYLYSANYSSTSPSVFYTSTDGGATWNAGATNVFPGGLVQPAVVPNPLTQGDVWVTFARNSGDVTTHPLYRSQDGGATFQTVASVDSAQYVGFGAGTSPGTPFVYLYGRVGGATVDTMYKSEDLGQSWTPINNSATQDLSGASWVEGDMRTPNLVYVARSGRGVMYGVLTEGTKKPMAPADAVARATSRTAQADSPAAAGRDARGADGP